MHISYLFKTAYYGSHIFDWALLNRSLTGGIIKHKRLLREGNCGSVNIAVTFIPDSTVGQTEVSKVR